MPLKHIPAVNSCPQKIFHAQNMFWCNCLFEAVKCSLSTCTWKVILPKKTNILASVSAIRPGWSFSASQETPTFFYPRELPSTARLLWHETSETPKTHHPPTYILAAKLFSEALFTSLPWLCLWLRRLMKKY